MPTRGELYRSFLNVKIKRCKSHGKGINVVLEARCEMGQMSSQIG